MINHFFFLKKNYYHYYINKSLISEDLRTHYCNLMMLPLIAFILNFTWSCYTFVIIISIQLNSLLTSSWPTLKKKKLLLKNEHVALDLQRTENYYWQRFSTNLSHI